MEKSWIMKNWPKVMYFVISHGILPILPLICTKFEHFLPPLEIKHQSRKSAFSDVFCKMSQIQNRKKETVMEQLRYDWSEKNHAKVRIKYFVKSLGTLIYIYDC